MSENLMEKLIEQGKEIIEKAKEKQEINQKKCFLWIGYVIDYFKQQHQLEQVDIFKKFMNQLITLKTMESLIEELIKYDRENNWPKCFVTCAIVRYFLWFQLLGLWYNAFPKTLSRQWGCFYPFKPILTAQCPFIYILLCSALCKDKTKITRLYDTVCHVQ